MEKTVSRKFRKSKLKELIVAENLGDIYDVIISKPISNVAQKNEMVNLLIDDAGYKLVAGERRSYNTGMEPASKGRARTQGRTRVCKKLKKEGMKENVKEQGEACLEKGKQLASTQGMIEKIKNISIKLKSPLLREIARSFKVSNVNRKTKQQLVEALAEKGIRKFDPTKFV